MNIAMDQDVLPGSAGRFLKNRIAPARSRAAAPDELTLWHLSGPDVARRGPRGDIGAGAGE
jgi:hypothetical protein